MTVPKLHYISDKNSLKEQLENVQKACAFGAELVLINLQNVPEKDHLNLALEAREITMYFQTRIIIKDNFKIAIEVKADGVHLENEDNYFTARKQLYTWQIVGATANTLQECNSLINQTIDYILLEPFKALSKKEKKISLGLNGYRLIIEALKTETPIIGFGDITTKDVTEILKTGISGVAVSEAINEDFNNIKEFNKLLKASVIDEKRHTF